MKNIYLLLIAVLFFNHISFAKEVDVITAMNVAKNFYLQENTINNTVDKQSIVLTLSYSCKLKLTPSATKNTEQYFYYVFNVNTNDGFVIISGDDNVKPILGYSDKKTFEANNIAPSVAKWLESYKEQIRFAIEHNIIATKEIANEWVSLESCVQNNINTTKTTNDVSPIIQTNWDQSPYYNDLCPGGSVTGCVATAMAQVMKFWNYPANGSGFHSYNHSTYGTLAANYGSTIYQWNSMPNIVTSTNNAVATLMYQCGVSVNMGYSPQSSGAYVISSTSPIVNCTEYALKTYFGYPNTVQGLKRSSYTDLQWKNLLKNELNNGRPIIYDGHGTGGGHCFVCDGYNSSDYFHFNWGWSGSYDGYFLIDALNPGGTGTGGGTGGYNSFQEAVIGITPPASALTYNLDITVSVNASSSSINYGSAFSISTNITNIGTNTFTGTYCAAVFDQNDNFIDYVDSISELTGLQPNYTYTNNLVFSNTGDFALLPGNYNVYIYYKPTGGEWQQIHASGLFTWEHAAISIINPNTIEMYSSMSLTPATIYQGQSLSVNLNLINTNSVTFYGQYNVALYKLDGTFVEDIGTINENNGLPYNYYYISPYLTFTNTTLMSNPGTYLIAVIFKSSSATNWSLVGSSNYQNPIKIIVQAPPYLPDIYEPNENINQSYNLPLTYNMDFATKNTTGSNCHTVTDNDYYKIILASGYNYNIGARLQDSYNSNDGNTYTLDAQFSYSTDGTSWSGTYDDIMTNNIIINNGGTVYFHVTPYYLGQTGTYLLQLGVQRISTNNVEENQLINSIKVFPNPATNQANICYQQLKEEGELLVYNMFGQMIFKEKLIKESSAMKFNIENYKAGLYKVIIKENSIIKGQASLIKQ